MSGPPQMDDGRVPRSCGSHRTMRGPAWRAAARLGAGPRVRGEQDGIPAVRGERIRKSWPPQLMKPEAYRPPFWYRGRHLQTIWGPLVRQFRRPRLRRERLETPDGDFVDLDWHEAAPPVAPLVLVLHGLEGSSRSHYVSGLLREAARLGLRGAVLNFRSCGGEVNRLARLYHSGETTDLQWLIGRLIEEDPGRQIGVVGISLGGNVTLKWLGELGEAAPPQIKAAVAISTPFDLEACARV